jgi:hypothetical protein
MRGTVLTAALGGLAAPPRLKKEIDTDLSDTVPYRREIG